MQWDYCTPTASSQSKTDTRGDSKRRETSAGARLRGSRQPQLQRRTAFQQPRDAQTEPKDGAPLGRSCSARRPRAPESPRGPTAPSGGDAARAPARGPPTSGAGRRRHVRRVPDAESGRHGGPAAVGRAGLLGAGVGPAVRRRRPRGARALHGRGLPRAAGAALLPGPLLRVGPHDHHAARPLPAVRGRAGAGRPAAGPRGRRGLRARGPARPQPAAGRRRPLPAAPAARTHAAAAQGRGGHPEGAVRAGAGLAAAALLLRLPLLHRRGRRPLRAALLPPVPGRAAPGGRAAGRLRRALPPDQRGVGGLLRRHPVRPPAGRLLAGGAAARGPGRGRLAARPLPGRPPGARRGPAGAAAGALALRAGAAAVRGLRAAQRRAGAGRPGQPPGLPARRAAALLLRLRAALLLAAPGRARPPARLPGLDPPAPRAGAGAHGRLRAGRRALQLRPPVPAGGQPALHLLRVAAPAAGPPGRQVPAGARLRLRGLGAAGLAARPPPLLAPGLPGLRGGGHRAPAAAGAPLLPAAPPAVPAARAPAAGLPAAVRAGRPRRPQRRRLPRLPQQALPLARPPWPAALHVVTPPGGQAAWRC